MTLITDGTIDITTASATVTGTGTTWNQTVEPGDLLIAPDGSFQEVASVQSNTTLTLTANYSGATVTGQAYKIIQSYGARAVALMSRVAQIIDFATDYYNKETILAPVGFASGEPTGGIIESGAGSEGRFIKYADGTLMCFHTPNATYATDIRLRDEWIFPAAFVGSPPVVMATVDTQDFLNNVSGVSNEEVSHSGVSLVTLTRSFVNIYAQTGETFGTDSTCDVHCMAVGRWA